LKSVCFFYRNPVLLHNSQTKTLNYDTITITCYFVKYLRYGNIKELCPLEYDALYLVEIKRYFDKELTIPIFGED